MNKETLLKELKTLQKMLNLATDIRNLEQPEWELLYRTIHDSIVKINKKIDC